VAAPKLVVSVCRLSAAVFADFCWLFVAALNCECLMPPRQGPADDHYCGCGMPATATAASGDVAVSSASVVPTARCRECMCSVCCADCSSLARQECVCGVAIALSCPNKENHGYHGMIPSSLNFCSSSDSEDASPPPAKRPASSVLMCIRCGIKPFAQNRYSAPAVCITCDQHLWWLEQLREALKFFDKCNASDVFIRQHLTTDEVTHGILASAVDKATQTECEAE
jgi:hypothetical protein